MPTTLVTGGAGFIGRWISKKLIDSNHKIVIFDNLSNGRLENIDEFKNSSNMLEIVIGDVRNKSDLNNVFTKYKFDNCIHAAAQINVQESLDDPDLSFDVNIVGTKNILDFCLEQKIKIAVIGTCMVYDMCDSDSGISENHPEKPASPYAASKLASEHLALSYFHGYDLPVTILRPFNTYGPFQKTNMEGGVVSVFVKNNMAKKDINVFGDGKQTRDLLYVEDCADFIVTAIENSSSIGKVINAGSGREINITELALLISTNKSRIKYVEHHHPQSEVQRLKCDSSLALKTLNWKPKVSLEKGIELLEDWFLKNPGM